MNYSRTRFSLLWQYVLELKKKKKLLRDFTFSLIKLFLAKEAHVPSPQRPFEPRREEKLQSGSGGSAIC